MPKPLLIILATLFWIPALSQDTAKHALNNNCDALTLRNEKIIYSKIISITHKKVSYINCNDSAKKILTLPTDSVLAVNYNGVGSLVKDYLARKDMLRPWISASYGSSLPVFKFKSPGPLSSMQAEYLDYSKSVGEDALPGSSFNVGGYIPFFLPNIGITAEVGYATNPFDAAAYTHTTTFYSSNNLTGSIPNKDDSIWNESAGNYGLMKFMLGFFQGYCNNRFSLIFSIKFGLATCKFPNISYMYKIFNATPRGDTTENVSIDKATALGIAYQLGLTEKFKIYKIFNIVGNIEYFSCNAIFPYSIHGAVPYIGNNDNQAISSIAVGYRLFNFTIGLAVDIWK